MNLKEALKEREEASAAALKLAELVRELIGKLRDFRYTSADDEARRAEERLKKILTD